MRRLGKYKHRPRKIFFERNKKYFLMLLIYFANLARCLLYTVMPEKFSARFFELKMKKLKGGKRLNGSWWSRSSA